MIAGFRSLVFSLEETEFIFRGNLLLFPGIALLWWCFRCRVLFTWRVHLSCVGGRILSCSTPSNEVRFSMTSQSDAIARWRHLFDVIVSNEFDFDVWYFGRGSDRVGLPPERDFHFSALILGNVWAIPHLTLLNSPAPPPPSWNPYKAFLDKWSIHNCHLNPVLRIASGFRLTLIYSDRFAHLYVHKYHKDLQYAYMYMYVVCVRY